MQKLLWLDDEPFSISYEKDILIPEKFPNIEIVSFEKIDELLEYLYAQEVNKRDIFVIDIMLLFEDSFTTPQQKNITIENDLMAGVILYREYLKSSYINNPILLYTSREHDRGIFNNIFEDDRYDKSLFLIEKAQKDTLFLDILRKFI